MRNRILQRFSSSSSPLLRPGGWRHHSSLSRKKSRILISGGGIGGLALAYFLQKAQIGGEVVVFESKTKPEKKKNVANRMGLGIWVNALRCLEAAGLPLPSNLSSHGYPHSYMLDSGYQSVDGMILAKPGTMLQEGTFLFCRRGHLLSTLRKAIEQQQRDSSTLVTIRKGVRVLDVSEDGERGGVVVSLKVEEPATQELEEVRGEVFIGADGMFSRSGMRMRQRNQSRSTDENVVEDFSLSYRGYRVFRGIIEGAPLQPHFSFQTWGPASRFASVPLKDGQVWFATLAQPRQRHKQQQTSSSSSSSSLCSSSSPNEEERRDKQASSSSSYPRVGGEGEDMESSFSCSRRIRERRNKAKAMLLAHYQDWHHPIPQLIEATKAEDLIWHDAFARLSFDDGGNAKEKQQGLMTLIGDAAHGVDPILAQGAGVAIEDAYELTVQLAKVYQNGTSIKEALRAYEKATVGRAKILATVSNLSQSLGQMRASPTLLSLRDNAFYFTPQFMKGPIFDLMIRLSLVRHPSDVFKPSSPMYGYEPSRFPSPLASLTTAASSREKAKNRQYTDQKFQRKSK